MDKHAFVTGANGFVGTNLVRELTARDWRVTALVREDSDTTGIDDLPLRKCTGDITDRASVDRAMPAGVDAVFHVAASTNLWSRNNARQSRTNIDGTANMIEAALAANAGRFIHVSSFVVYGFHNGTIDEDSERLENGNWINYTRTKSTAEQLVRNAVFERSLDAVILNPAHILGPHDRSNWSRVFKLIHSGKLPGVPPGGGSFADVREIAKAAIAAWHKGRTGHNYLLGGTPARYSELVRIAGEVLGRKVPERATPAMMIRLIGRAGALVAAISGKEPKVTPEAAAMVTRVMMCNSGKAQKELDYRYTDLRTMIENTCGWMRSAGLLTGE